MIPPISMGEKLLHTSGRKETVITQTPETETRSSKSLVIDERVALEGQRLKLVLVQVVCAVAVPVLSTVEPMVVGAEKAKLSKWYLGHGLEVAFVAAVDVSPVFIC
jgi:hypothetical protein